MKSSRATAAHARLVGGKRVVWIACVLLGAGACASGAESSSGEDALTAGFSADTGAAGTSAAGVGGAGGVGGVAGVGGAAGVGSVAGVGGVAGDGSAAGVGGVAGVGSAAGVGAAGDGSAAGVGAAGDGGAAGVGAAGDGSAGVGAAGDGSAGDGSAGVGAAGDGSTAGVGAAGMGAAGMGAAGMGAAGMGAAGVDDPPPVSEFPAARDFTRDGTFDTTSEAGGFTCTIYRPRTLGEEGRKHPVVVWGNGTTNSPSSYDALFHHFASHGFIVSAANTSNAGSGNEMIACLEYILAQNESAGVFQGKVDIHRIAAAGYSQGGAGTMMAGRDPRFVATAPIAPYVVLPLGGFLWSSVRAQIHPMFMLSGGSDLVAVPGDNQLQIFETAPVPIVWAARSGAGHLEVLGNGGNYRGPLTAWFRYRLMDDSTAAEWFEKGTCLLCDQLGWNVEYNDLWTE